MSISAIVTVSLDRSQPTDLTEINERLDDQQSIILQNRGLIINNTEFNVNQFEFNNDVIGWAGNVSAKIDGLANAIP